VMISKIKITNHFNVFSIENQFWKSRHRNNKNTLTYTERNCPRTAIFRVIHMSLKSKDGEKN
jgi:hypothetical protein